jgi:tRNA-specific 2-thiouridylase
VDPQGKALGQHTGLADYTIGQRKGLRIANDVPLYVIDKKMETRELVVGPLSALGKQELTVSETNWISGIAPTQPFRAEVKIRYRAREAAGVVTPLENGRRFKVDFEESLRDITPGQAAVVYNRDEVIGSGIIQR